MSLIKDLPLDIFKEMNHKADLIYGTFESGKMITLDTKGKADYLEGLATEYLKSKVLLKALEHIGMPHLSNGPLSVHVSFIEWIDTARDIAKDALKKYNAIS